MRKLMWFTVGFAAACGLCVYGVPDAFLRLCTGCALGCAFFLAIPGRKIRIFACGAIVFLGFGMGIVWQGYFRTQYLAAPSEMDGTTQTAVIRTTDYSYETAYGIAVDGEIRLDEKTYPVRAYLDQVQQLEPGLRIEGPFRFAMTVSQEDPASYHAGKGIFLLAYQEDEVVFTEDTQIFWRDRNAHLRLWLQEAIHAGFPADAEPFARALLLGDTTLLDYETDTEFKVSGIRHVIAVSGLHVSILFALLGTVTFRKKFLMVPIGLGALLVFAALAGFSPSVSRACIMSGLLLLAMLFDREYDDATALSFAVLVMLLCNPLVITSVSFQLSAASVAGIYLLDHRIRPWLQSLFPDPKGRKWKSKMIQWFSGSVSITLSAMTLTTPLCAYYFGMVSLVGIVTNLLVLWIVSGIFYGIMAVCLLQALFAPAAAVVGWIVSWLIRYVLRIARIMADVPLAAVYTDSVYIVLWLIFVYILLAVFCFSRKRNPWQLLCCGILGLCMALLVSWSEPEDTRITVLDVGQGQCILLQSAGRTYMVDCGGDSDTKTADIAAGYLLSRGITRLDGLVVTHLDRDHAGAVENLLSRLDTELLILPSEYSELSADNTVYASENLQLQPEETKLSVFAPTFPGTGNEKSLCVLFETENCDILITGDRDAFGERMLLRNAQIPEVDVLIAGHHGSKHSTCEELLFAVSPEIVCISAGRDNSYGHPAPELLQRLAEFGCAVYRTDLHGTITIRR